MVKSRVLGPVYAGQNEEPEEQARLAAEEEARFVRAQGLVAVEEQRPFPYTNIQLEAIEPWNGGNYNWRYPKRGLHGKMIGRKWTLLLFAITAVALPVAIAFIMSWFTPTIGLGDRGIMELSYCAMWLMNWIITIGTSMRWDDDKLFKIYIYGTHFCRLEVSMCCSELFKVRNFFESHFSPTCHIKDQ